MTFLFVGFDQESGFSGGIALNPEGLPLSECGRLLDQAVTERSDPPFPLIADEIPETILESAFSGEDVPGYTPEQVGLLTGMIAGRVPKGAMGLVTRRAIRVNTDLIDWVNYLSCGDREARVQALRSVPLHSSLMIKDQEFRELVDARSPLTATIAKRAGLSPEETRRYAQIEARFATILARDLNGEAPLTNPAGTELRRSSAQVLGWTDELLRTYAITAAQQARPDQVPATPGDAVELLAYVYEAERIQKSLSIGETPFRKHMGQVSLATSENGVWGRALDHLKAQVPVQETSDYLRSVSTALVSGLLVDRIRTRGEVDLDRIGQVAHALREKVELSGSEAEYAGAFIKKAKSSEYQLSRARSAVSHLIGEEHSLKTLKAAQTRWHHVRATYENEVMTSREPLSWSPMIGEADLGGVRAVELTSSAALDRQGRLEKHCVGGYTGTVMGATSERASLIFSLERNAEILSTIEIRVKQNPWDRKNLSWEIVQNKATRNATPPREAIEAGKDLLALLSETPRAQVRAYLGGIRKNETQLRDTLAVMTTKMGADITNRDLPDRVMSAYSEVLPKRLRSEDLGALRALMEREAPDALNAIDVFAENLAKALPQEEPEERSDIQLAS